jgi:hypothetical protein
MIDVNIHLEYVADTKIEVSEEIKYEDSNYRTLNLGENAVVFMSTEQAEKLFNKLDAKLHKKTYTDMEDRCLTLESELEKANELIEELEDRVQEDCCQVN